MRPPTTVSVVWRRNFQERSRTMTTFPSDAGFFPDHFGQGLALVDYDNVCRYENRSGADVALHTADLLDGLAHTFRRVFPDLKELDVRLYGGWTDEHGVPGPLAFGLLKVLPLLRGRRHGLIVRPSLATALVQFPNLVLQGTVRLLSRPRRQKMIDGMLGCDAMFVAATSPVPVGLVTDDEDLVPAALSAHAASTKPMVWMRPRLSGRGLNDRILWEQGLRVQPFGETSHA